MFLLHTKEKLKVTYPYAQLDNLNLLYHSCGKAKMTLKLNGKTLDVLV